MANLVSSASAATFTLTPSADSYVKNSVVSSNFGADANFIANNAKPEPVRGTPVRVIITPRTQVARP